MSAKYTIGVDIATGSDYTSYTVMRRLNRLEKLWAWLRHKNTAYKVIYFGDDERTARKFIRKKNAMTYLDGPEAINR